MFKFGLQRVLELREKKEQEAATELAALRERAEAARRAAEALALVRQAGEAQLAAAHAASASTVGELRQLAYVLDQLDQRIAAAEGTVAERDADVDRGQLALNAAFQDRRVLDRLKERHLDAWRVAEVQLDRQTMDAVALTRFGKRDA